MISKESLVLIAVLIVLVISFMGWSEGQSKKMQNSVNDRIEKVIEI